MQLTTLIVSVLGLGLLLLQMPASATPATIAPTNLIATLPTIRPPCLLPPVCAARSPRVCGRTSDGMCRRFHNICELLEANGRNPFVTMRWTHTPRKDCRRVRETGAQHAYWCYQDCPNRTVVCPRPTEGQEICIRSRNHQVCKLIANRCQLLNNNCFGTPRDNWRQTDRRRCIQMQLGDKPHACRQLPSIEVTIRPLLPTSSRTTTTEPPKDHETTTTLRSTTGRS
ncbi:uncharacterized protein LOC117793707 [Drosophila innubila]|uniref:uncharacterized protein LOC117793707 n=1 Tax=Drosophila innubila TaxID=198719 RepID=UPI00148E741C|nr:uncharacterized protein LOC117793707 [Drosophila innubila]